MTADDEEIAILGNGDLAIADVLPIALQPKNRKTEALHSFAAETNKDTGGGKCSNWMMANCQIYRPLQYLRSSLRTPPHMMSAIAAAVSADLEVVY